MRSTIRPGPTAPRSSATSVPRATVAGALCASTRRGTCGASAATAPGRTPDRKRPGALKEPGLFNSNPYGRSAGGDLGDGDLAGAAVFAGLERDLLAFAQAGQASALQSGGVH